MQGICRHFNIIFKFLKKIIAIYAWYMVGICLAYIIY